MNKKDRINENVMRATFRLQRKADNFNDLRATLIALAKMGARLRKRYELECSEEWACNSEHFARATAKLEKTIREICADKELHLFLQGDCRGATVYVSRHPIAPNNYSGEVCCYFDY